MPPWWSKPLPPEEPKEPSVDITEIPAEHDAESWQLFAWRMRSLIDAFRCLHPEPLSLEDIDLLGLVAEGQHDLHDACAALRAGCRLELLAVIYT